MRWVRFNNAGPLPEAMTFSEGQPKFRSTAERLGNLGMDSNAFFRIGGLLARSWMPVGMWGS